VKGFHDIIRKDRATLGGGVAIFVKENIVYKRLIQYEKDALEALWVQINSVEGKCLIGCVYRPPDRVDRLSSTEFWELLDEVVDDIKTTRNGYIYVLGDLNADLGSINGQRLKSFCAVQNLKYLIEEPTRVTATTATVLDQILTNAPNFVNSTDILAPVSTNDHCTVAVKLNFRIPKEHAYQRLVWQFDRADVEGFRNALRDSTLDTVIESDDINTACSTWTNMFMAIAKVYIPNRIVTVRPRDSPWYNNDLRLMKRKLNRLFRKFCNSKNNSDWLNYSELHNAYHKKLNETEKAYNEGLSNSLATSRNSKTWWRTVKHMIGRGGDRSYPALSDGNNMIVTNTDKATAFNQFFLSQSKIDSSSARLPYGPNPPVELDTITASEQEVSDIIHSLDASKSAGPDGISPKLLKLAGNAIVQSLTKLINKSLSLSKFPKCWKEANVIPLHKKGDKSDTNNYRPVSLLSCVGKVMEKIVFKNVFNYVRDRELLSPHQSGFRPGDSSIHQLSYLYHVFAQALDCKKNVKVIFCDISKAFDRCWHEGIIYKLSSLGIGGDLLLWFKDYLTERFQKVVIRGQCSELGLIEAGVPQGSVLGPLLFLIYINDLPSGIQSNMKLFADDVTLYITYDVPNVAQETLSNDLRYIEQWANNWLVNFSAPKTKSMTVTFQRNVDILPPLMFNNQPLDQIKSHKHLGLTLSDNLTWSAHIKNLVDKVSPMADVLKKLKYQIDRKSLETIYFTFIRPKLEYACHVWDNCSCRDRDLLENFQIGVARIVCGARKGTSHNIIYEELGWDTLKNRRLDIKDKQFNKITQRTAPEYLYELIPSTVGSLSQRNLRNSNNIQIMKCRTETFRKSFIPSSINRYNNVQIIDNTIQEPLNKDLYNFGIRSIALKHAQLRMGCSLLSGHLYSLHVLDSPSCQCGFNYEDSNHYLLHCPLYVQERNELLSELQAIGINNIDEKILLKGSSEVDNTCNFAIFQSVHKYIESTNRL